MRPIDMGVFMRPEDEVRQTATSAEQIEAKREALLVEREGYARAGNEDRVKAVDAELDRLADPAAVAAAEALPASKARAERRSRGATTRGKQVEKRG